MTEDLGVRRAVLHEVRQLVSSDGADFEVLPNFDEGPVIELRLILPDASCEECVMPRSLLEELAAHLFQAKDPSVESVRVHDPREGASAGE